jgi:hypothetical protein
VGLAQHAGEVAHLGREALLLGLQLLGEAVPEVQGLGQGGGQAGNWRRFRLISWRLAPLNNQKHYRMQVITKHACIFFFVLRKYMIYLDFSLNNIEKFKAGFTHRKNLFEEAHLFCVFLFGSNPTPPPPTTHIATMAPSSFDREGVQPKKTTAKNMGRNEQ